MASLPLVVIETDGGAEVRLRGSEEPGEPYASLREALDSLLTDEDYRPKAGILRSESGEQVGVWRWLDATAEESAPAPDGSQVTRELIATMAARLNAGSPAPMDGGTSPAHAQLSATETRSDGYVHTGVEVQDRAGRWHLYVYAETSPDVARDIDSGRLAYGSIGFSSDGRLLQHALTNVPAVEGLRPNNSVRGAPRGVRISFRSMRISVPTNSSSSRAVAIGDRVYVPQVDAHMAEASGMGTIREIGTAALGVEFDLAPGKVHRWITESETSEPPADAKDISPQRISMPTSPANVAKRGPALDLLAKIAGALGVSVDDEMSAESYESPVMSALSSIKMAAQAEKVLEQAAGGTPATPAAPAEATAATATQRTDAPVAPPVEAPRAEGAFADAAAMEMFASEALAMLRDIFGKADAMPAEVLDLAKASLAAFKGALGQGAPPDDAGADAAAMSQQDATAARAALTALPALRAEVASLRAEVAKRDTRESIQRRAVEAKATLSGEQLEQLVADTLAVQDTAVRERMIVHALRSSIVPTGDVFARTSKTAGPAPQSITEAAESLLPEIEKANPNTARHVLVSMAQRAAIARFPHLSA